MTRYELTSIAQEDLNAIVENIALDATVNRALEVLGDFRDAFRKLGEMPGMGHFREDLLDQQYKFWLVHTYVIAYRWQTSPIQIIAIIHGARDLNAFFSRRPA